MKTSAEIRTLAIGVLFVGALIGLLFLTSCEKEKDPDYLNTYITTSSDIKTESLAIYKDDWCCKHNYHEVCLPVKGFREDETYEFIEVYIRGEEEGSENWFELPMENISYRLEDYKIYVQKYDTIEQDYYYFLIKMKVKSQQSNP